ncbi:MAG: preprotein translocase subunit SecE [Candidatus Cloacimonadales bacterium]|nr:preprotein translocase subunit SecE [Candidatus Cloacimonadota bacterium]MDD2650810.1 preprotein translocase subunit SecE [Candidatus Cloacimonadota bacterium]MDX9977766.1 preprotein translocase subunit SecE [Candidatus Cloacimonadales bacterium]
MKKIQKFFKEVIREMKYVSWPNKHDIKEGTIVVIVMSAIVSIFLSLVDLVFGQLIHIII